MQLSGGLEAIEYRHDDVNENKVGLMFFRRLYTLGPILSRLHGIPVLFEQTLENVQFCLRIINYKNSRHFLPNPPRPPVPWHLRVC
jgi:hypothetical protein